MLDQVERAMDRLAGEWAREFPGRHRGNLFLHVETVIRDGLEVPQTLVWRSLWGGFTHTRKWSKHVGIRLKKKDIVQAGLAHDLPRVRGYEKEANRLRKIRIRLIATLDSIRKRLQPFVHVRHIDRLIAPTRYDNRTEISNYPYSSDDYDPWEATC